MRVHEVHYTMYTYLPDYPKAIKLNITTCSYICLNHSRGPVTVYNLIILKYPNATYTCTMAAISVYHVCIWNEMNVAGVYKDFSGSISELLIYCICQSSTVL